ncbi:MAG: peptidase M52 [Robiginitomaculum sp.]|nr:MAG: peptidase M52 [Robiginitomaculum sp.]
MPTTKKLKAKSRKERVLVLGVGNTLLSDDGVGVHVTEILRSQNSFGEHISIRDGGTIGLSLLPEIEQADRLIVVDAARIEGPPGTVQTFENAEMDAHLSTARSTVHEVALADLLDAAALSGAAPKIRTLVAIQPEYTRWGLEPTPLVKAAIPIACTAVRDIIERWSDELD